MTFAQLRAALRAHGLTVRYDGRWQEYRVNFADGAESTAYYTDDKSDAYETGLDMAQRRASLLAVAS
jgi:hypothetical protein